MTPVPPRVILSTLIAVGSFLLLNTPMALGQFLGLQAEASYASSVTAKVHNNDKSFTYQGGQALLGVVVPASLNKIPFGVGVFGLLSQFENNFSEPAINGNPKGSETLSFMGGGLAVSLNGVLQPRLMLAGVIGSLEKTGSPNRKQSYPGGALAALGVGYSPFAGLGPYIRYDYQLQTFGLNGTEEGEPDKKIAPMTMQAHLISLGFTIGVKP